MMFAVCCYIHFVVSTVDADTAFDVVASTIIRERHGIDAAVVFRDSPRSVFRCGGSQNHLLCVTITGCQWDIESGWQWMFQDGCLLNQPFIISLRSRFSRSCVSCAVDVLYFEIVLVGNTV